MFTGTFYHGVDDKGRVIVPAKLRVAVQEERDGAGFWLARGLDGCIAVYTPREWEALRQRIPGTEFSSQRRNFERVLYSGAQHVMCDRQGRIILPEVLTRGAGIVKDIVVIGTGDRIEILAQERWEQLSSQTMETFEDDAQKLFGLQWEQMKKQ